jgi:hypothetical protein
MENITLDNVTYPMMVNNTTTPEVLRTLVRREGEFSPELTQRQKTTLKHLEQGLVVFLRTEFGLSLYLIPEQVKVWEVLN